MFSLMPYRNYVNRANRAMVNPFNDDFFRSFFDETAVSPFKVNIEEKDEGYVLTAELPGVKKEDVHVKVNNGVMYISAETHEETDNSDRHYLCRERRTGSYSRAFNLDGIDDAAITADYTDGVLTLNLPKLTPSQPESREICIN